jgi:hypothetical protein
MSGTKALKSVIVYYCYSLLWGDLLINFDQIEPAIPKQGYPDYAPLPPMYYLDRTAQWINAWRRARHRQLASSQN